MQHAERQTGNYHVFRSEMWRYPSSGRSHSAGDACNQPWGQLDNPGGSTSFTMDTSYYYAQTAEKNWLQWMRSPPRTSAPGRSTQAMRSRHRDSGLIRGNLDSPARTSGAPAPTADASWPRMIYLAPKCITSDASWPRMGHLAPKCITSDASWPRMIYLAPKCITVPSNASWPRMTCLPPACITDPSTSRCAGRWLRARVNLKAV